jgi:hypothetical protein
MTETVSALAARGAGVFCVTSAWPWANYRRTSVFRILTRYLINVIGTSAKWMTFMATEPSSRP